MKTEMTHNSRADHQWFEHDGRKVSIDVTLDPHKIADCLSAWLPIPLQTCVEFTESGMWAGGHYFTRIPKPSFGYRYDHIY